MSRGSKLFLVLAGCALAIACKGKSAPKAQVVAPEATPVSAVALTPPATVVGDPMLFDAGVWLARQEAVSGLTPDEVADVMRGLEAGLAGQAASLSTQELAELGELRAPARFAPSLAAAEASMWASLRSARGAVELPAGVVMVAERGGKGNPPTADDHVIVRHRGTLADGTVFASTNGDHESYLIKGMLPCWQAAFLRMQPGSRVKIGCPAAQAYGDQGLVNAVPEGAAVQFELELLEIAASQTPSGGAVLPNIPGTYPPR